MAFNPVSTLRRNRGVFVVVFVVCAAVFAGAVALQARALTQQRAQAESHARAVSNEIDGLLGTAQLDGPIDEKTMQRLDARLRHALGGTTVMAVRVWNPAGDLRYSSLPTDRSQPLMDTLRESIKGTGKTTSLIDGEVMTTYVPLRTGPDGAPFGAVEVQQPYGPVLAAAATPWTTVRTGALAVGILALLSIALGFLAVVTARRAAREGAGFMPGGARPPSTGAFSAEDIQRLYDELGHAEGERRALEGELERVRARLAADNERASARVLQLEEEIGRLRTRLQEVQVPGGRPAVATPVPSPDGSGDQSALRDHLAELEAEAERRDAELTEALERAREAEDRAAALQDRVAAAEGAPPPAAFPAPVIAEEPAAAPPAEPVEDGPSLRSRLARTAARKRVRVKDESEYPD